MYDHFDDTPFQTRATITRSVDTMANDKTKQDHPDADLHPTATGLAKQTVDAHTAEQPLKLYAGWFCPFVQRAWLVLEEKGIPYGKSCCR